MWHPEWSLAFAALGSTLVTRGKYSDAGPILKTAIELDRNSFPAYAALTDLLLRTQAPEAELKKALAGITPLSAGAKPPASIWAAKAGLEAAQQMKNEVNAQYRYTNVTAPISGTITAKFAEQGDMASPGMPLLTIESPSSLQAQILVSEQNITMITNGMPVQVTLKSINKTIPGSVAEISKSAANTGGQYMVKINVPNSGELLPGMFVNVQFPFKYSGKINQDFQESVMVPKSALVYNGQLTGVYVASSQKTAVLRWVKTGKEFGDQVEILSGLKADEPYIITSNGRLFNGAKIQLK